MPSKRPSPRWCATASLFRNIWAWAADSWWPTTTRPPRRCSRSTLGKPPRARRRVTCSRMTRNLRWSVSVWRSIVVSREKRSRLGKTRIYGKPDDSIETAVFALKNSTVFRTVYNGGGVLWSYRISTGKCSHTSNGSLPRKNIFYKTFAVYSEIYVLYYVLYGNILGRDGRAHLYYIKPIKPLGILERPG